MGKSATAIKLAEQLEGEVINCDSMQVYKGFDTGTDKVSLQKRKQIHHHLLDVWKPDCQFTAADFVRLALQAIESIVSRKKLPIITGGTGLYLKALLDGLFPEGKRDPRIRQELEQRAQKNGLESLREELRRVDPQSFKKIGKNDKIRIIRALEVYYLTGKTLSENFLNTQSYVKDFNVVKIGLTLPRKELYHKIEQRVDKMFRQGLVEETQELLNKGIDESSPPFRALGYKHVLKYLKKEISLEEAVNSTKKDTRHYAKRQITWFRKMKGIRWFSPYDFYSIVGYIQGHLK